MTFLYVALALAAVLVLAGLVMPSRYSIAHTETIGATPVEVHAWVGHLDKWPQWMPWEQDDPSIITSIGDRTTGVGAAQSWTSKKAGDGEVEFTECDESMGIAYDMTFVTKTKRAPSKASIRYSPSGNATEVTWSMEGDFADMLPPVMRGLMKPVICSMMSKNFTRGLSGLKAKVEGS